MTLLVLALVFLGVRQWLLYREGAMLFDEPFDGVVYRVGDAVVAERRCPQPDRPRATVICMHGFVENLAYFTHFYDDPQIQLILVNSCGYHVPITDPEYRQASWAEVPKAAKGTIEYDAMVLNQALEHLPRSDTIRVHGHSRGGAVILEAASLRPDLFENVEVVLEAPVLPQARSYRALSRGQLWFMSFLVPLWRRQPIGPHNRGAWGPLEDERKRMLIEGLPFNPKRVSTMVTNMKSLGRWMECRPLTLYQPIHRGWILVPEKDRVLDTRTMYESATKGAGPGVHVVRIEGCSHFPLFDRPDVIPPLPAPRQDVPSTEAAATS